MRNLLIGVIAAMTVAAPAHAVTFTSAGAVATPGGPADPGLAAHETLLVDFDHAAHAGVTVATSGNATLHTGSTSGVAAAPAGDASRYLALGTGATATVNFAGLSLRTISVYLGSIDSYNRIDVLNRAGNVIKTWTGNDQPPHNGDWFAAATNRRLFMNFGQGDDVGAVRFSSSGVAFEFDSIGGTIAGVPEPASWALMIGGFGLIGGTLRRRQRTAVRFA
ncbi:MAG TPA: PEPxxWA-CTERM sorting domain-containing protein [Sphingomonas sp.]|jgi:hypothetical protein|nr:PEPxxWA-CTERM sorting domain-containing protein [Sphingomonas sp.]